MRSVWLIVLFGVALLKAQIDTLEYLSYFPLNVGDRWQYSIFVDYFEDDTTYYETMTVLQDTLMPNGKYYRPITNSLGFHYTTYFRIDTSSMSVLNYFPYEWRDSTCVDSEIVIFELRPPEGSYDQYPTCAGFDIEFYSGMFQTELLPDSVEFLSYWWFEGFEHHVILVKGIGIYFQLVWELVGSTGILVAAEINSVQYGEFIYIEEEAELPERFSLYQNYPNPFNPITTIRFDLPEAGELEIVIYDILGREVMMLVSSRHVAGQHKVVWNASDVASGVYFYRLVVRQDAPEPSGSYMEMKKLIMLK